MIHPRSLDVDEERPRVPRWYCSTCQQVVDGPWHQAECWREHEDREVGS